MNNLLAVRHRFTAVAINLWLFIIWGFLFGYCFFCHFFFLVSCRWLGCIFYFGVNWPREQRIRNPLWYIRDANRNFIKNSNCFPSEWPELFGWIHDPIYQMLIFLCRRILRFFLLLLFGWLLVAQTCNGFCLLLSKIPVRWLKEQLFIYWLSHDFHLHFTSPIKNLNWNYGRLGSNLDFFSK